VTSSHKVSDHQLPRGAGDAGEVPVIPAASVILLRDTPLEVFMIRRHASASFVPDAWVFPGGMVDAADQELSDGTELGTMRVTAVRELFEESGIWLGDALDDAESKRNSLLAGDVAFAKIAAGNHLDLERLVLTSRWITPVGVPKRFDTYFFLAEAGSDVVGTPENVEAVEVRWIAPATAIAELPMVFPTMKNLEALAGFTSVESLLASRRGIEIPATRPVLVVENGRKTIILP
jgi:8-oxo-dGTP pyrophosphatase MutT (NUDIX family)